MARTPASAGMAGVGKSGSPAPRSITSSPAALRRFASCEIAMVAEVSRCCRLGERPEAGGMRGRIAAGSEVGNCEMQRCGMRDAMEHRPISHPASRIPLLPFPGVHDTILPLASRSEEHTSELQSRSDLVCRLLLEKKK